MKNFLNFVLLLLLVSITYAQDEVLIDASFADEGHSYINLTGHNHPNSTWCDGDGNVFIVGFTEILAEILLVKLTPNGNRDSTFSDDGLFIFSPDTCHYVFSAELALLPNGKIMLAANVWQGAQFGSGQYYLMIMLINQDGTFDENFGNGGVTQLVGPFLTVSDLLITDNENVYISCILYPDLYDITRSKIYTLDESDNLVEFGAETISALLPESNLYLYRMESWNDEILCVHSGGVIFKVDYAGELVTNFGADGLLELPTYGYISDICILDSEKVLALITGSGPSESVIPSMLIRINQDGTLDENYGLNGALILYSSIDCVRFSRLIRHPLGNIIVAGHSSYNCEGYGMYRTHFTQLNSDHVQVAMYTDDGTVDMTWGSYHHGVFAIQANGKIIFCGGSMGTAETQLDFHTMRIDILTVLSIPSNQIKDISVMSLSPNPVSTVAKINFAFGEKFPLPQNSELILIDVQGKAVVRQKTSLFGQGKSTIEMDISSLPIGMYTVLWVSENVCLDSVQFMKN